MKTFFIEQLQNAGRVKSVFSKVKRDGNKIIINVKMDKAKFRTKIKVAQKIKNILVSEKVRQVVIEKELKDDKELTNLLYGYNINICNPKWLFKQLTNEIIEEVLQDKNKKTSEIWICVNEVDSKIEEYIYKFAKEFKRINIVTNHIGKFKKIEAKLYEDEGILINVTNNKRKSLHKAELILNADFPKEILNQFVIYDNSIIINWEGDIKIKKKRFNGKIINDFKFVIDKESEAAKFIKENNLENFDERDICQVIEVVPMGEIILK